MGEGDLIPATWQCRWEGFVIETLVAAAPDGTEAHFFRTAAGAEIDLLLTLPGGRLWAFEIKRTLAPKVERDFHIACEDLRPERRMVIYPGNETFPMKHEIEVTPLKTAAKLISRIPEICRDSIQ